MKATNLSTSSDRLIANRRRRLRFLITNGGKGRGVITIKAFALRSGLSVSFVSKFARGEIKNPTLATLRTLDATLKKLESSKKIMKIARVKHKRPAIPHDAAVTIISPSLSPRVVRTTPS